jgi:hypothetical protein
MTDMSGAQPDRYIRSVRDGHVTDPYDTPERATDSVIQGYVV